MLAFPGVKRILLVEDDADIAYSIRFNLEKGGEWQVEHAETGARALECLGGAPVDLVLLDLNLPDLDGHSICREIRRFEATSKVPIVMLTARVAERDRVRGLDLGADDYVTKPFSMAELVARVRAHLRRETRTSGTEIDRYDDGHLAVEPAERRVWLDKKDIRLTKTEFDILWLLLRSCPRVLSRPAILERIWSGEDDIDERTVDVHVHALRRKLGGDSIETVVGVGYRFGRTGTKS